MFRSRLTVTVPKPCQEDWQAMTPAQQGRFCNSCQKAVVDFTVMTDAQVVKWLSDKKGDTCGRFRGNQLGEELLAAPKRKNNWNWKLAVLGLAGWLSAKTVEGKEQNSPLLVEQQTWPSSLNPAFSAQTDLKSDSLLKVNGQVIDAQTKEGMPGASIRLKGTDITTSTDVNGYFLLTLPKEYLTADPILEFSFIGYMTSEKKASELQTASIMPTISMHPDVKGMTDIVVGGAYYPKWYTPKGIYFRITNLFR